MNELENNESKEIKSILKDVNERIEDLNEQINEEISKLKELRGNACYPLLLRTANIGSRLVDDVYDDLRNSYKDCDGKIDVIIDSGGGDIDSAYNLALLLRKFAPEKLNFIVPRWAKSAATLLVCSGDNIFMSPVAELGPIDPQITQLNPLERRLEQFSPLHIESTLELIREEFQKGNEKLAQGLIERLQFPLTLGSFKKSIDIGKQYLIRLLSTRMLKDEIEKAKQVAYKLTEGYTSHGFCIEIEEARDIGLSIIELRNEELDIVWKIYKLYTEKQDLLERKRAKEIEKMIKSLPPEVFDALPSAVLDKLKETKEA